MEMRADFFHGSASFSDLKPLQLGWEFVSEKGMQGRRIVKIHATGLIFRTNTPFRKELGRFR